MTTDTLHPLAAEYLEHLRRAGRGLPPGRLRELLAEIEGHLSEAIDPSASDAQALTVLDKLGEPEAIIAAEMPDPGRAPGSSRYQGMGRDRPTPDRRFHLRCRMVCRSDSALELARLEHARQMDRNARHTRRPRDQRAHRTVPARHAHQNEVSRHRRRRAALHERPRTKRCLARARSHGPCAARARSDRDLGLPRAPRGSAMTQQIERGTAGEPHAPTERERGNRPSRHGAPYY